MSLKMKSPFTNPKALWYGIHALLLLFLLKKEMSSHERPPGYDPPAATATVADTKPKTKSVKRNERKKEKRIQHDF
ncbi:hypothetical protein G4B88_021912 [Cannabis sativa]|uniref:Uncharacterized protein n=1 Tax=Cannabis sativa TaxID=3483 RepID=A0A7J6DP65_CANSA|nr:hypothetical protein G4B88_021912 [Cannabis sativa]